MEFIQYADELLLEFITMHMHNFFLDTIMVFCTNLGEAGFIWLAIALIMILNKKYRIYGIMALCALLLATIFGEVILKPTFARSRPFISNLDIPLLISAPHGFSFPSS
ncbi:MAG: phosphatase PAP2 family protein, partial [Bacillota bacterium]